MVQLLRWERDGRPATPAAALASPEILAQIARWLDEAGTAPAGEPPGAMPPGGLPPGGLPPGGLPPGGLR